MKKILIFFIGLFILSSCGGGQWKAFVYPYGVGNESTWKIKDGFNSIEECRTWVKDNLGDSQNADYECGYKCKYDSSYGIDICKETKR